MMIKASCSFRRKRQTWGLGRRKLTWPILFGRCAPFRVGHILSSGVGVILRAACFYSGNKGDQNLWGVVYIYAYNL